MVGVALAQDTAALSPAIPSVNAVYDPCKVVSENPETADIESGICVGAAQDFLGALAGLDPAATDQALADAVVAIAPLAIQDELCNDVDDEIAAAIRILSTRSSTAAQTAQLEEIAATIDDCVPSATAAIPRPTLPDGGIGASSPA